MKRTINTYQDLIVWQKSIELVTIIYKQTRGFPSEEKFGIISQMRRCAVSISSNIAEGHARIGLKEFMHFLSISLGSVAELETQIIISKNLNFMDGNTSIHILEKLNEINRMIHGLRQSLSKK